jgi:hypothetical protein
MSVIDDIEAVIAHILEAEDLLRFLKKEAPEASKLYDIICDAEIEAQEVKYELRKW